MKTKEEVDALFEQVKHLIESDELVEHPWEVQPHELTESERTNLLEALPKDADETATSEFIRRVGLAIGTYHRLDQSENTKLSNSEARKNLRALRNSVAEAHDRFVGLPVQFHGEVDLALQHVLRSKQIEQGGEPAQGREGHPVSCPRQREGGRVHRIDHHSGVPAPTPPRQGCRP